MLTYQALPSRVIFGAGAVGQVAAEIDRLGAGRALLIDGLLDPGLRARIEGDLGGRHAGTAEQAVEQAVEVAPQTPAPIDRDGIRELLGNAYINGTGSNGTGEEDG